MSKSAVVAVAASLAVCSAQPGWAADPPPAAASSGSEFTQASAPDGCQTLKSAVEVYDALHSKSPEMVLRGMKCGLRSDDSEARGMVIAQYLSDGPGPADTPNRMSVINLMLDANLNDTEAAKLLPKMPDFSVWGVRWSPSNYQFTGNAAFCCQTAAAGNLVRDTLTITYNNWPIPTDKGFAGSTCTARLTLDKDGTQMSGPLRCYNLPYTFRISLGL